MKIFLRTVKYAGLLCLGCAVAGFAQDTPPGEDAPAEPTKTFFLARSGEGLQTPHIQIIHYLEFFQERKKWIVPDIGYVDFGHGNYREFYIGGGRALIDNRRATWEQELLYVQATGPAAHGAAYLQPWSLVRLRFTPKLTSEASFFAYFPVNDPGRFHQVLERAKLEYALKKPWKVGAGYAESKPVGQRWGNKPFLTTTLSTKEGAFEFWLQKIPAGAQIEIRYVLVHTSR